MASKRKPLDDARRRVKEKLNAIDEQKKFIQNSIDQITSGVKEAANLLLTEGNKTKFFQKYRAVSQELEKCLDDLLLISATISSLEDNEEEGESDGEDEKPPDDISPTACHEEMSPVTDYSKHKEINQVTPEQMAVALPADEKPNLIQLPADHAKRPVDTAVERNLTSAFSNEVETATIIELTDNEVSEETHETKDLIVFAEESPVLSANEEKEHLTSSYRTLEHNEGNILPTADQAVEKAVEKSVDSTAYVNDLFMLSPSLNTSSETIPVNASSRRASFEENGMMLDLNCKSISSRVENVQKSSSPSPVRLQRIGFCEYKSHEADLSNTVNNNADEQKLNLESDKQPHETRVDDVQENVITTSKKSNFSVTEDCKTTSTNDRPIAQSFQVEKVTDKAVKSPMSAGDVIEEALREKTSCKLADVKDLYIPPFDMPTDKCIKVTVKEIISPNDFWIQKANDDLDLLMEKMCYYFSKRAKTGDKGGMKELPPVGHVCCGRYTVDDVWYRVLVTAVSRENLHVQVLYVDEGNGESLPLSRLRELDGKFARLPCQALHVQLRGLELSKDVKLDKVNDWFKRRVSGEIIEAILIEDDADFKPVPIDLYIRPHARSSDGNLGCQKLEYNIHEMLIREGFAVRTVSPKSTGTSSDVSPPSTPSDQFSVIKSESASVSSEVTSGFHDAPSPILDVSSQNSGCCDNGVILRVPAPVIPVDSDGSLYMLVSHVVSPGEFYVHFISSEAGALDDLMTDMNQAYQDLESETPNSCSFSPRVGDFCCARFSADGNWYRGLVLQVRCSSTDERVEDSGEKKGDITVEVFYIDFGNIEQVNVGDLRELSLQLMSIPAQVVRCSLADVNPSIKQVEFDSDVFDTDMTSEEDVGSGGRSRGQSRKYKIRKCKASRQTKAIAIAAGDEDTGEELVPGDMGTGDMDTLELLPEVNKNELGDRLRSSISDDIAKSYREPSLFFDTAVELFEKVCSGGEERSLMPSWSESATEYFKTLTLNAQKLVGYVVPWDSEMLNSIMNYSLGGECSLPNLGPVLKLNLYDVSNDIDVFINAAMVQAEYATSSSIKRHEDKVEANCSVTENPSGEAETRQQEENLPVVRVHHQELSQLAETTQDSLSTPPQSVVSSPSSPLSPTSELLDAWNPMSRDYQSFRNAYNVNTDNLDVAIIGYEENDGKICRFYRTKYGCFRGSKCPDKHIEQDVTNQVVIYGSPASVLKMPEIGAWVLVRVTAIYNPSHFWVQLPYGVENVTTQLIKSRSGGETSGEENVKEFDNLMKQMSKFYSKIFKRQRSVAPPAEGELVVVRSAKDNEWYRGQVRKEKDSIYQVLLVDFGNTEWIDRSNVCPIMPQFLHLPFQSIECYLANISPNSEGWSEESKQHFKSLTDEKLLFCQILSILNKTMFVNLFQSGDGESRSITEDMIKSGHANEAKLKLSQPHDLKSLQSPKSLIAHPG